MSEKSRSMQRRKAAQKGEPTPEFYGEFSNWPTRSATIGSLNRRLYELEERVRILEANAPLAHSDAPSTPDLPRKDPEHPK